MTNRSSNSEQKTEDQPAPAAAAYPPWVILSSRCFREAHGSCSCSIADVNTFVSARTSTGDPIAVHLRLGTPPEGSHICVNFPYTSAAVVAAHGDSVLIRIDRCFKRFTTDYFVYTAGHAETTSARPPPSLSLLPPPCSKILLDERWTGLLRPSGDELVVVGLKMVDFRTDSPPTKVPELHLLRSSVWTVTHPAITHAGGKDLRQLPWWITRAVPVGDGMLCWADKSRGLMLSNVFDESPELRYVPLPVEAVAPLSGPRSCRNVCATSSSTVKFIDIFPRCCCGGAGASRCRHSQEAYTIHTWKLRMDDMAWVMDGVVDCTELWSLDAYAGLPRQRFYDPVVSLDDSDTICFMVSETFYNESDDHAKWLIMVDMRSKTILSVHRYHEKHINGEPLLASRVSHYFNTRRNSSKQGSPHEEAFSYLTSKTCMEVSPSVVTDKFISHNSVKSSGKSSAVPMQVSWNDTIISALEGIPGLNRNEIEKSYDILSRDKSGRRYRFLLKLPENLRKEWLLLEI